MYVTNFLMDFYTCLMVYVLKKSKKHTEQGNKFVKICKHFDIITVLNIKDKMWTSNEHQPVKLIIQYAYICNMQYNNSSEKYYLA